MDKAEIDHGLHGGAHSDKCEAAAKAYLEHQQLLSRMRAGEEAAATEEPMQEPAQEQPVQKPAPPANVEFTRQEPVSLPITRREIAPDDDQVIKIPNKQASFEVAYPDFESGLAVAIRARDIDMDEDSLSVLMDDSVSLKMPKWKPLYVKIHDAAKGEIIKKVVWGGGTHSFGKVKHLSFIIVTDDGKES